MRGLPLTIASPMKPAVGWLAQALESSQSAGTDGGAFNVDELDVGLTSRNEMWKRSPDHWLGKFGINEQRLAISVTCTNTAPGELPSE